MDSKVAPPEEPRPAQQLATGIGCLTTFMLIVVSPALVILLFVAVFALLGSPFAIMAWVDKSPIVNSSVVVALAVTGHFGARFGYAKVVDFLMRRSDGSADVHTLPDTDEPREARPALRFKWLGRTAVELTDRVEEFAAVSLLDNDVSRFFNRGVYLALLLAFGIAVGFAAWRSTSQGLGPQGGLAAVVAGYTFIVALLLGFINARWTGEISFLNALVLGVIAHLWIGLLSVNEAETVQAFPLQGSDVALLLIVYGFIVTVVAIFARLRAERLKAKAGFSSMRLLILRVFGIDRNVQAVFREIGRRWLNIGPLMTIVDASSASFDFKRYQTRLVILAVLLPSLLPIVAPGSIAERGLMADLIVFSTASYLVLLAMFTALRIQRVHSDFARNVVALKHRIAAQQARGVTRKYRQGRMYCFSNTWRSALEELVDWTNVVLMDLRGITEKNQGVAYEINYLFNHFDLARTVFLIDEGTDQAFVENLMSRTWQRGLAAESPNARTDEATVNIYAANRPLDLAHDLKPMMALFAEIVAQDWGSEKQAPESHGHSLRHVNTAIWMGWGLLALGVLLLGLRQEDGLVIGSGFSIVWFSIAWLMLARRVRSVLTTLGSTKHLFASSLWNLGFAMVAGGWAYWYLAMPAMK